VRTERILLGTAISSVFVRSAPTIAMAAATVDHLSSGRFILGLGSSHKVQVEPEHGLTFAQPVQRLRESIEIVRALLRDGEVSHRGQTISIERFDLWFSPRRAAIPIYVAAVFPTMLEICGEIADGALLTWCTLDHAREAARHVAAGARRAGRASAVDVATLLSCSVSADRGTARDRMRAPIATYAFRFPRYRRLMAESGFATEVEAVRAAWADGDPKRAMRLVPDGLIDRITVAGTAEECRTRIGAYRDAGITLPIVMPRIAGPDAKRQAMEVIEACAPR
jgi:alkanesulfonate monooxygenase SsuD/methylene tetrahydromethanopterin reductase-like flavin-dependent oxidoreductase (luciferase family)